MSSSNTNFTQNQDTSIIPGIYNLNDPLEVKMNALRNSLSRVLARGRYHKAVTVCDAALRLQYDAAWAAARNAIDMISRTYYS